MRKNILLAIGVAALVLPLAACNDPKETATDATTEAQTYGPSPTLPPPQHSWIPTVDIASVNRWPDGTKPTAANGMTVTAFATGLDHPRTVYVLPNGDVLVAESNAPPKQGGMSIKGFIYGLAQSRAGAGVPSANRIMLLRDVGDAEVVVDGRDEASVSIGLRHGQRLSQILHRRVWFAGCQVGPAETLHHDGNPGAISRLLCQGQRQFQLLQCLADLPQRF